MVDTSLAPAAAVDTQSLADERGARPRGPAPSAFVAVVVLGCALRGWRVFHNGPSYDESFTAMAGRRPVGDLVSFLARADSHPPLDYLLRMPFARAGASEVWLRAPSLVLSCAALALFATWMRRRSWLGLLATVLFACSTFQVLHGGEARMYALLQLLGVAAAMVAERWLRCSRPWHGWAIGGIVLVALFDHASGLLLGLGLLVLCGRRTDRAAWRLRSFLAAAGAIWAVAWLPVMVGQLDHSWSDWVPRTTPGYFADVVNEQFVQTDALSWIVAAVAVAGGIVIVRRDQLLGRLWLALGAVPFAVAAGIGAFTPFLLPRTLTLASWAPVLAVAVVLDEARRRGGTPGRAVAVLVPALVLLATVSFLAVRHWDYDLSMAEIERVAQPGDVVAVRPARYGILLDWRFEVRGDRSTRDVKVPGMPDTDARRVLGAAPTGRVWLLTPSTGPTRVEGRRVCAPPWSDGTSTVRCFEPRR